MIKCAIFDLDGTLVNTIDDIGLSCDYLIKKYGYNANWNEQDYIRFVGSGARLLVDNAFGNSLNEKQLDDMFEEFKLYYDEHKLDHAHLYEGIKDQLDSLKQRGIKLAVVTNKPHIAAVDMCECFFGKDYFISVQGNELKYPTKPDPTTTLLAIDKCGCSKDEVLYFGDSDVDMQTAINAGVKAVGVSWGYRSRKVLQKYNPFAVIDNVKEMSKLF